MEDKCGVKFITEEEASNCDTDTLDEIKMRIHEADPERPRGRMQECWYVIGCSKGWTATVTHVGSGGYRHAKAAADRHAAETGHSSGVISSRCISVE